MIVPIGRMKITREQSNQRAREDPAAFFRDCDAAYEQKLDAIVRRIAEDPSRAKVLMLSGPSASGKTTTSLKLRQGLAARGIHAAAVSMDDFFRGRNDAPLLPDGGRDFESLQALDVPLLETALAALVEGREAHIPVFNFKLGRREERMRTEVLGPDSVAIVEGLHALDPRVASGIPAGHLLRVYVSVSSDFVDESGATVLSAREMRLIRRTVRDSRFRASPPERTLEMWDDVCRGEDLYVRPYKRYADITVNSAFRCEPCLFGRIAGSLFRQVPPESPFYERASRVAKELAAFEPMELDLVPPTCLLREFLGGSVYFNKSAGKK